MVNYAICEISGKQYKVIPGKPLEVDFLSGAKEIKSKVLILSEDGKLKVGNPYLKETLNLQMVESLTGKNIRVANFHSKANYTRVKGYRSKLTKVVLPA